MCSRMLMSTLPCGFKMRRTCPIHATVQEGYSSSGTPPYSFARCIAYGGEVTTASTEFSRNDRMTSRQSPSYSVHFANIVTPATRKSGHKKRAGGHGGNHRPISRCLTPGKIQAPQRSAFLPMPYIFGQPKRKC